MPNDWLKNDVKAHAERSKRKSEISENTFFKQYFKNEHIDSLVDEAIAKTNKVLKDFCQQLGIPIEEVKKDIERRKTIHYSSSSEDIFDKLIDRRIKNTTLYYYAYAFINIPIDKHVNNQTYPQMISIHVLHRNPSMLRALFKINSVYVEFEYTPEFKWKHGYYTKNYYMITAPTESKIRRCLKKIYKRLSK